RGADQVEARLAGGQFEVFAAASMNVEDLALFVDSDAGRSIVAQKQPLSDLTQAGLPFCPFDSSVGSMVFTRYSQLVQRQTARESMAQVFAPVKFPLALDYVEEVGELADGFGVAQQEEPARGQRVMKEWQQPFLQHGFHVNEHVAATD